MRLRNFLDENLRDTLRRFAQMSTKDIDPKWPQQIQILLYQNTDSFADEVNMTIQQSFHTVN